MTINAKVAADLKQATTIETGLAQVNAQLSGGVAQKNNIVHNIVNTAALGKERGLNEVGRPIRVQPVVIVEEAISKLPYLSDTLQTVTNMVSAYYLQAFGYLTAGQVTGVNVLQVLRRLNPSYRDTIDIGEAILDSTLATTEQLQKTYATESFQYPISSLPSGNSISLESNNPLDGTSDASTGKSKELSVKESRSLQDAPNLAVGKILEVTVSKDGNRVSLPVQVILNPWISSTSFIVDWMGLANYNDSLYMRFIRMKTGEITFWKDLVFMQDIIAKRNRVNLKDKSGIISETLARRSIGILGRIFAKDKVSAVPASNVMVVSANTVKQVERQLGGSLASPSIISRIFKETALMMIVEVDDMYGSIRVFQRGETRPMELTDRDIKTMAKSNGGDINTILTSLMAGKGLPF